MKRTVTILASWNAQAESMLSSELLRLGFLQPRKELELAGRKSWWFQVVLESDDQRINNLSRLIAEATGSEPAVRYDCEYNDLDLDNAAALDLTIDTAPVDVETNYSAALFDEGSGCRACRTSAVQVKPLMVQAARLKSGRKLVQTCLGNTLLHRSVVEALNKYMTLGVQCLAVLDSRGRPLEWQQWLPGVELPRMHPTSRGVIRSDDSDETQCAVCGRDGYFDTQNEASELVLGIGAGGELPADVCCTWEHFGKSRGAPGGSRPERNFVLAQPRRIVTQRVRQLFMKLKLRGLRWTPVSLLSKA